MHRFVVALAVVSGVALADPDAWTERSAFAQIRELRSGWPADRAGLRNGDRVVAYAGVSNPGFEQVLALDDRERRIHQVAITIERAGSTYQTTLIQGDRGWRLVPDLAPAAFSQLDRWLAKLRAWQPEDDREVLEHASVLRGQGRHGLARWLLWTIASELGRSAFPGKSEPICAALAALEPPTRDLSWNWRIARAATDAAVTAGRLDTLDRHYQHELDVTATDPSLHAQALVHIANLRRNQADQQAAHELALKGRALAESIAPGSLLVSDFDGALAWIEGQLGDFARAIARSQEFARIRLAIVPETIDAAEALDSRAEVAWQLGDLNTATRENERAAALRERLAPLSRAMARSFNLRARIAAQRGELEECWNWMGRERQLMEQVAAGTVDYAWALNNLGVMSVEVGDYQAARRLHLQSLAIRARLAPGSLIHAYSLLNLGGLYESQGDYPSAHSYASQALEIFERRTPGNIDEALTRAQLGAIAHGRQDYLQAEQEYRIAIEIFDRLSPWSYRAAKARQSVGWALLESGQLDRAAAQFQHALEVWHRLQATAPMQAASRAGQAEVRRRQGDPQAAEALLHSLLQQLEPYGEEQVDVAGGLQLLGRSLADQGKVESARDHFERAIERLQRQRLSIGGSNAQLGMLANETQLFDELVALDVRSGDARAVLRSIERSRVQGLVERLAAHSVDWEQRVPAELSEQLGKLRREKAEAGAKLLADDPAVRAVGAGAWSLATTREDELIERLLAERPELGSLYKPQPVELDALLSLIPARGVVIAFATTPRSTIAVAVRNRGVGPEFRLHELSIGSDQLSQRVQLLRGLLRRELASEDPSIVRDASAGLHRDLIAPFSDWVRQADQLLIVPDGAIHLLPLSLLFDRGGPAPAITLIPSLTMLSQLQARAIGAATPVRWVGVGDPEVAGPAQSERARGRTFLPGARQELDRLEALIGSTAQTLRGRFATIDGVLAIPTDTAVVHFACHALAHDEFPMQSALVLAASGDRDQQADEGWLQAHEVFDRVRLKADLVVLSGCSTGTGRLARGEGLLGLTRGFLFGGARSVVATLWPVADRSTALLMEQFYRGLIEGKNKARALRDAQAWLASQPQYSHPYFWAGFELIGDDRPIDKAWPRPARVGSGAVAVAAAVLVLSGLVGWWRWRRRTRATG